MYHIDEYATQQARQNSGLLCKHCGSPSGHFKHCPLICRETAEAHSATLCQADTERLHGWGVRWDDEASAVETLTANAPTPKPNLVDPLL